MVDHALDPSVALLSDILGSGASWLADVPIGFIADGLWQCVGRSSTGAGSPCAARALVPIRPA